MQQLFNLLANLDRVEAIKYFCLIAFILAIMPYFGIISKYLKHIVHKKNLEIHFFEYSISQNIYAGKDEYNNDIFIDLPGNDILISGTKIRIYWKVDGALKIDIHPVGKGLKGNSVEVLIDHSISKYTLVAHGFWGEKLTAELFIPKEHIYHLDTTKIVSYSDQIVRGVATINTLKISEKVLNTHEFSQAKIYKMRNFQRLNLMRTKVSKITTVNLVHSTQCKRKLYKNVDEARILKGYVFSTKKYNNIN